jgi:quinol monooxygenase YgiN
MSGQVGLLVTLRAKPGRQEELARFLTEGASATAAEPGTLTWYSVRLDEDTFAIFDTFADEQGRQAHIDGDLADALREIAPEVVADVQLRRVDVLGAVAGDVVRLGGRPTP